MANYEATRYDWDGEYLTGIQGISTGTILPWSSAAIPSGFLECNGAAVSQATYADLFAVIAYTYGNPGGGNFNLPDLTDRTVVNKSNTKSLATTGGANTVAKSGAISGNSGSTTISSATMPSHAHGNAARSGTPSGGGGEGPPISSATSLVDSGAAGAGQGHSHTVSGNLTGGADSVLQPYIVVIYIIKT
jgi:microcystin-dependent protein